MVWDGSENPPFRNGLAQSLSWVERAIYMGQCRNILSGSVQFAILLEHSKDFFDLTSWKRQTNKMTSLNIKIEDIPSLEGKIAMVTGQSFS